MRQAIQIEAIDEGLRVRLHARFPRSPRWAAPAPAGPSAWEIIRQVLDKGRADGLDDVQLAGGIYTVLVSHGLVDGGRA
jgi:hypothetical protein